MNARRFKVSRQAGAFKFEPFTDSIPLLVVDRFGQGNVAAFATDFAPHWVGGLVDWGDGRTSGQAEGSVGIEVGNWYARFVANLVRWTAKLS